MYRGENHTVKEGKRKNFEVVMHSLIYFHIVVYLTWLTTSFNTVFQPDALLHFLEEFCAQDGEFSLQQEAQAEESSTASFSQLGVDTVVGQVPEGTIVVGSPAADMDSINELIQADHQYYKEEPSAPAVSCVASIPSSTVHTDLLHVKKATSLLAPASGGAIKAELVLSGAENISSSTAQYTVSPSSAKSSRPRTTTAGNLSFNANSKAAMATMVDPNLVYSPRPKAAEPASLDSSFLDMDVGLLTDELGLDCLLDFGDLQDITCADQTPPPNQQQQQQTVIAVSTPAPVPSTKSKCTKSKQNIVTVNSMTSAPTENHVSSPVICGLESDVASYEFNKLQQGNQSPDSGFSSDSSDFASHGLDIASSPDSCNSSEAESFDWQEEFSVPLDLFPDVGLDY